MCKENRHALFSLTELTIPTSLPLIQVTWKKGGTGEATLYTLEHTNLFWFTLDDLASFK